MNNQVANSQSAIESGSWRSGSRIVRTDCPAGEAVNTESRLRIRAIFIVKQNHETEKNIYLVSSKTKMKTYRRKKHEAKNN